MSSIPVAHAPPRSTITVLISGNGSNLQALIDACESGLLPSTTIARVISNTASAYGLVRAQKAGIPTTYHNLIKGGYCKPKEPDEVLKQKARERYCDDLADLVLVDKPDLVVCAGWMMVLAPTFLVKLSKAAVPVINLHPALPGMYDGVQAMERAYADFKNGTLKGDRTGIMVHYVIKEVDQGQPVLVREVQIRRGTGGGEDESFEEMKERMHAVEHEMIVKATGQAIAFLWEERKGGKARETS